MLFVPGLSKLLLDNLSWDKPYIKNTFFQRLDTILIWITLIAMQMNSAICFRNGWCFDSLMNKGPPKLTPTLRKTCVKKVYSGRKDPINWFALRALILWWAAQLFTANFICMRSLVSQNLRVSKTWGSAWCSFKYSCLQSRLEMWSLIESRIGCFCEKARWDWDSQSPTLRRPFPSWKGFSWTGSIVDEAWYFVYKILPLKTLDSIG